MIEKGESKYGVVFKSEEAVNSKMDTVVTQEGKKAYVCDGDWTWATGSPYSIYEHPPSKLKTFDTIEEADEFMEEWDGHPWYYTPKSYEIIIVEPQIKVKKEIVGYNKIDTP